jgi:tetrahydromethanopterin S-methyltransferase subunit E
MSDTFFQIFIGKSIMENKSEEIYTALEPINSKELYKSRRYENLYFCSLFICKLSILINIIAIFFRVWLILSSYNTGESNTMSIGVLVSVIVLHILIIVFSIKSIISLKRIN